jgi:hypothetical protein
MTLHLPTHPVRAVGPHVYRNLLIAIVLIAVAVVALYAAITIYRPAAAVPAQTQMERMVEFREGERSVLAPLSEEQRAIEFRASERGANP